MKHAECIHCTIASMCTKRKMTANRDMVYCALYMTQMVTIFISLSISPSLSLCHFFISHIVHNLNRTTGNPTQLCDSNHIRLNNIQLSYRSCGLLVLTIYWHIWPIKSVSCCCCCLRVKKKEFTLYVVHVEQANRKSLACRRCN